VPARAIVVRAFGSPEVLRLEAVETRQPGAAEILVRVRAGGVNPVDAYIASGNYARKPALPYTPGSDGAGDVEGVGADITDLAPGDRVYIAGDNTTPGGAGTFADYALCRRAQLHRLADRVSYSQGAALGVPYATAYRALFFRAAARPDETVLVHGATGGVGVAAVQLAAAHGMTVIGTGGSSRGLDIVRAQGARVAVDHTAPGYLDEILRATGGRGVDVILEMAAHVNLDRDLGLLARGGRVVVIGSRGRVEIDARQAMARDAAVLGMLLFNAPAAELASIHAAIEAGLASGALNPVVGREWPLADAPRAIEAVLQPGAVGKIVLVP
jgi:NADPH2:quinone reductase